MSDISAALAEANGLLGAGDPLGAERRLSEAPTHAATAGERAEIRLLLARAQAATGRAPLARASAALAGKLARDAGRRDLAEAAARFESSLAPGAAISGPLEEQAFNALSGGRPDDAVDLLGRAAVTYEAEGRHGDAGRALFGQGLAMSQAGASPSVQREVYGRSMAFARLAGDLVQELKARQRIANTFEAEQDWSGAKAEVEAMLQRVEELGSDRGIVDCRRHLAVLELSAGRPNAALAHLDIAVPIAERIGDPQIRAQARIERRSMQSFALSSEREREPFADLKALAEEAGLPALAGSVELQEAAEHLREGRIADGLVRAEEGRQRALAVPDLILYVSACMLLAEGHEKNADRVSVIDILLTCKATLDHHLGKAAGSGVVAVLDSLEGRWGKEALTEARLGYRRRAAERLRTAGPPQ